MKKYLLCCAVLCCVFTSCEKKATSGSGNSPSRSVASTDQSSILPDSSEKFNHGVQDATEAVSMFTLKKGDTLSITPISLSDDEQHITISFGNGTVTKQLTLKVLRISDICDYHDSLKINGAAENFVGYMNGKPLHAFPYYNTNTDTSRYYGTLLATDNKIFYNSDDNGSSYAKSILLSKYGKTPVEWQSGSYTVTTADQECSKPRIYIEVGDLVLEKVK